MADEVAGDARAPVQGRRASRPTTTSCSPHPQTGRAAATAAASRAASAARSTAPALDDHRFHDLRHTFGTRMAAAGVPMRTLQEWMGHRDISDDAALRRLRARNPEAELVAAFARLRSRHRSGYNLSESQATSQTGAQPQAEREPIDAPVPVQIRAPRLSSLRGRARAGETSA